MIPVTAAQPGNESPGATVPRLSPVSALESQESPTGALIVFEGLDGTGKTTQVARVAEALSAAGVPVLRLREPGGTPLGEALRGLLLAPEAVVTSRAEALLFLAARAQLVETVIRPAMAQGTVVLLDRMFLSTYAYQGAGRALGVDTIAALNAFAVDGMRPTVTLVLTFQGDTVSSGTRIAGRGTFDRIEAQDATFHARVSTVFETACTPAWRDAHPEVGPVVPIDAGGSVARVTRRILGALLQTADCSAVLQAACQSALASGGGEEAAVSP